MNRSRTKVSSSKFAWLTQPGAHKRPAHDVVVASNEFFVAVPSLGALVPGWVLLVPRRPMPTLSLMTSEERLALKSLREELMFSLADFEKTVFAFEHGGESGSVVSCGVDQAHLHLVPLSFDLLQAAREHDLGWRTSVDIHNLTAYETGEREYLFVERSGTSLIGFPKKPTSQWFRKLIAHECGVKQWDYKQTPNLAGLRETVSMLTSRRTAVRKMS